METHTTNHLKKKRKKHLLKSAKTCISIKLPLQGGSISKSKVQLYSRNEQLLLV